MAPKKKSTKGNEAAIITGSQALQLKARLDAGGTLDDETLLKLLRADVPCEGLYSKACKSKGQNPNCLCNIIPAPGAFRRAGLWAKNSDVTAGLGFDPSDRRRDPTVPAGLRNLGNTCYVNSVLQCLFANAEFRNTVYAAAPPVSEDPVVKALKQLFVQMQQGPASPVDPAPLAMALQLDHAVQQDGQEFMKLLLTLLEHRFASQPNLHGVIQSLFRGQSGYETLCMTCNTPSESSSRSDNFYELDVPVRGFKSLDASLTSLLSPEILDGENQFSCDRCAAKRDATRRLQVRTLPPMLCLSLQRFVYDYAKGDRVKATDKFAFPLELPASALVGGIEQHLREELKEGTRTESGGGGGGEMYDLEAILIHKGGSALQGHYVAHIKLDAAADGSGGTWWRFDDETVTKMEEGPFGTTDHGAGAGGISGISTKGGGGGGGPPGAIGSNKKKRGRPGKSQTGEGARKGASKRKGVGKTAAAAATAGGGVGKEKKQPAKKKAAGRKKKGNDRSCSENEIENEATAAAAAAAAAAVTDGEQIRNELAEMPSAATGGASAAAEVVNLLDGQTTEELKKQKTEIVSSNAYLLVYRRRGLNLSSLTTDVGVAAAAAAGENENTNGLRLGAALDPETSQWLLDSKSRLAEEFDKQCEAYKTAKADAEMKQTARRLEVRNLLESAAGYVDNNNNGDVDNNVDIIIEEGQDQINEEEGKKAGMTRRSRGCPAKGTKTPQQQPGGKSAMIDGDCGRFISATWLQEWADAPASSPLPPIDNAPLLCPHGKLDPARPSVMRRLPTHAWTALASNYRGGPELKPSDSCPICLGEVLDSIAAAEDSSEARDHYLDVAELMLSSLNNNTEEEEEEEEEEKENDSDIEIMELDDKTIGGGLGTSRKKPSSKEPAATINSGGGGGGGCRSSASRCVGGVPAYYVSKSWLQSWYRRGGKSMGVTPPTQSLCCPHGGLMPEPRSTFSSSSNKSSKKIGISDDFWAFLKRSWQLSETERLRKARAKAAEKLRKNQGGAAVLDGEKKKEKDSAISVDADVEVIEIDGEQVLIPIEKNPTTNKELQVEEKDDNEEIEIIDSPKAEAAGTTTGAEAAGTITNISSTLEITPLAEFPLHTEECPICRAEIDEATRFSKDLHSRVQAEKSSLAHLLTPGFMQLTQGETYYLIPRAFMDHWRAYMTQASAGRRGAAAAAAAAAVAVAVAAGGGGTTAAASEFLEAPSLAVYMKRAACDCHSDPHLIAFAPPAVVNRRGRWLVVNNSENSNSLTSNVAGTAVGTGARVEDPFGFFELVSVADWSAFVEHYAEEGLVFGVGGISAMLQIQDTLGIAKENADEEQQTAVAAVVKKSDGGDETAKDTGDDDAMPDAPAALNTRDTSKAEAQEAVEANDSDAQLARALAAVEAEDAKAAAKENGEIETDDEEEDQGGKKSKSLNIKKKKILNEDEDFVPASQVDEGTVFGQDPDFLYDRKPGTGNAHLRPGAAGKAWLVTVPPTCTSTLEARQIALKAARLSYTGAEIMVEICLTDEEAISATLAAMNAATGKGATGVRAGGVFGGGGRDDLGERKSKRARKGRAPVIVDCTSTLHDLRLRIYQAVGVHPRNARLYCRGQIISDTKDEITVSELEIYPNEEIRVVDTQEHDPDDLTGLFLSSPGGNSGKKGRRGGPEGFGGTALTGLHLVESSHDHHNHVGTEDIEMQKLD
ncbi:hypothetical protein Ndes2437B_g05121 [Nannochloris sp. 'desiccata']